MDNCKSLGDNKGFRILAIYERLLKGGEVNKEDLSNEFNVSLKTIQRDIEDLRSYITETHFYDVDSVIEYDRRKNCYKLVKLQRDFFTPQEALAISKILLESRAFKKTEATALIEKMLTQAVPDAVPKIQEMLKSDIYSYKEPLHQKELINLIWLLTDYINSNKEISFTYQKQDLSISHRVCKPLAIMFSEYYFYLAAADCNDKNEKIKNFRIDRIEKLKPTGKLFSIPYSEKFRDGEYKNRIQFMYPGDLIKVKFKFNGDSLQSVLDRLPTAKVLEKNKNYAIVEAEVFKEGAKRWFLSQKNGVEVISPIDFRNEMKEEIEKILENYK